MGKVSERVVSMKQHFMEYHEKGYSIPEIAKEFNLGFGTIYRHLQEIADENGTTREELLKIIQTPRSEKTWRKEEEKVKINVKEMEEKFDDLINSIDGLVNKVHEILEEENEQ